MVSVNKENAPLIKQAEKEDQELNIPDQKHQRELVEGKRS